MTPRVLLAQSTLSPNIGRLAIAFRRAGFAVDAVAPARHPIHRMRSPDRTFIYRPTSAYISFREAIDASRPELLVPCDDRIVGHLHKLHEASAQSKAVDSLALAALIEFLLGLRRPTMSLLIEDFWRVLRGCQMSTFRKPIPLRPFSN